MPQGALVKRQSLAAPRSKYLLELVTGVHVPVYLVHQKPPTLPIQDLCEQVSQVLLCWDVGNEGFTHCNGLMYCMIADRVWFLLEHQLRFAYIGYNRHVVALDIWGLVYWDAHHTKLVANGTQILNAMMQSTKFSAKHSGLNCWLLLQESVNHSMVEEADNPVFEHRLNSHQHGYCLWTFLGLHPFQWGWGHWGGGYSLSCRGIKHMQITLHIVGFPRILLVIFLAFFIGHHTYLDNSSV